MNQLKIARPVYAAKAKIVDGQRLYAQAGITHDALGEMARCHQNTVRTALQGRNKQYIKAHDIFTALNSVLFNSFSRAEHVHYFDTENDDYFEDKELDKCLVFPKFDKISRKKEFSVRRISDSLDINPLMLNDIQKRRPVDENIVWTVFDVCLKFDDTLNKEIDLIR